MRSQQGSRSDLKRSSTCPFPRTAYPLNGQQQASARLAAQLELERAPCCSCCPSLRQHVRSQVGSTLFFDEDPMQLQQLLHAHERTWITPRMLAACIVLDGRERVELTAQQRTHDFPAARLLLSESIHAAQPALPPGPRGRCREVPQSCMSDLRRQLSVLICCTAERSQKVTDSRLPRALAFLWAAAESLE